MLIDEEWIVLCVFMDFWKKFLTYLGSITFNTCSWFILLEPEIFSKSSRGNTRPCGISTRPCEVSQSSSRASQGPCEGPCDWSRESTRPCGSLQNVNSHSREATRACECPCGCLHAKAHGRVEFPHGRVKFCRDLPSSQGYTGACGCRCERAATSTRPCGCLGMKQSIDRVMWAPLWNQSNRGTRACGISTRPCGFPDLREPRFSEKTLLAL